MRKIYPLGNAVYRKVDRRRPGVPAWAWLLGLAVFLLVAGAGVAKSLYPAAAAVGAPAMKAEAAAADSAGFFFGFFRTKSALIAENKKLKEDNASLLQALAVKKHVEAQKAELERQVGRIPLEAEPTLARVIGKPQTTPYDILTIDAGTASAEGIEVGADVVVDGSILLGQVLRVSDRTSQVRLLSSPGVELPVLIGGSSTPAFAKGLGAGNFKVDLPRGADVRAGDYVVSPSFEKYVVGVVGAVDSSPSNPFITVLFRSPVNLFSLNWVEIYD